MDSVVIISRALFGLRFARHAVNPSLPHPIFVVSTYIEQGGPPYQGGRGAAVLRCDEGGFAVERLPRAQFEFK